MGATIDSLEVMNDLSKLNGRLEVFLKETSGTYATFQLVFREDYTNRAYVYDIPVFVVPDSQVDPTENRGFMDGYGIYYFFQEGVKLGLSYLPLVKEIEICKEAIKHILKISETSPIHKVGTNEYSQQDMRAFLSKITNTSSSDSF